MSATHTVNFEAISEILLPSLLQGDRATVRSRRVA